jgi:hypothetical protein
MKVCTTTTLSQFEVCKVLSAQAGFKIFTPSRHFFRAEHQFIAASNDTRAKGVFRLWIRNDALWIEFLPFYDHQRHRKFLADELGTTIRQRRHHPAMRRFFPIHKMVIAAEHREFDMLVPNIRLP